MKKDTWWLTLLLGALGAQVLMSTALYSKIAAMNENISGLYQTIAGLSAGTKATSLANRQVGMVQKVVADVEPGDGPALGAEDAPVTIVEFSDFSCAACRTAQGVLKELVETSDGAVRLVFRHFPQHEEAAVSAECAGRQGAFWPMHDLLFAEAGSLQRDRLLRHAASLNLDRAAFETCLDAPQSRDRIRRDQVAGQRYGVLGTPTLFINGRMVIGTYPAPALRQLIEQIRAEDGA